MDEFANRQAVSCDCEDFFLQAWLFSCKLQRVSPMSDPSHSTLSSSQDTIVCKPTQWFILRVLAMLVMFSVFAVLFIKDGISGYREQNLQYFLHHTFNQAGTDFQGLQSGDASSEGDWKAFSGEKTCLFPEDAATVLPKGADLEMPWPTILVEGYAVMKEKGGQNGANKLWEDYTSERGWPSKTEEHPHDAGDIQGQFVATAVALALIAFSLFILIRTLRRTIEADGEALYSQDGQRVLYVDMIRVDKRKWDTKGIALVYYQDGGEEKKVKIDGMVYGQFKEENGAPAERLFSRVMENFKGEVLEYVDDGVDQGDEAEESRQNEASE